MAGRSYILYRLLASVGSRDDRPLLVLCRNGDEYMHTIQVNSRSPSIMPDGPVAGPTMHSRYLLHVDRKQANFDLDSHDSDMPRKLLVSCLPNAPDPTPRPH